MSEQKDKLLKQRKKAIDFLYYAVLVSASIAILIYVFHFGGRSLSDDPEDWAVFGDFIGGTLNPIFAFFSFVLLLLTLSMQRKQLDKTEEQLELNREELRLTREELKKAADAQIDSAKVMNEQLKTQFLQQFDSFFFNIITQFTLRVDDLKNKKILEDLYKDVQTPFIASSIQNQKEQSAILSLVYEILNAIDDRLGSTGYICDTEKLDLKENYRNIIVSILPEDLIYLMVRDALYDIENEKTSRNKNLIEKFRLFENLLFNGGIEHKKQSFILSQLVHFDSLAFRASSHYLNFKKHVLYDLFFQKKELCLVVMLYEIFSVRFKEFVDPCNRHAFRIPVDEQKYPELKYTNLLFVFYLKEESYFSHLAMNNMELLEHYMTRNNIINLVFKAKNENENNLVVSFCIGEYFNIRAIFYDHRDDS